MNYEEKHKEDLEAAKGWLVIAKENNNKIAIQILEKFFPELKESEDEKIRNFLIGFIKACRWAEKEDQGWPSKEEILSWIEKQGEQKVINEYNEHEPTSYEIEKWNEAYEKGYDIGYMNGKNEQNPAEKADVLMSLDEAIEHCKEMSCGNNACALEHKQLEKWLTELKELKEQEPAWSEEDENILNNIMVFTSGYADKRVVKKWVSFLKSLTPRQRQEWSEEDEHCIELLLPIIDSSSLIPKNRKKCKEFLKSLKPNHWKPSEEQLRAIINSAQGLYQCKEKEVLLDLYEQLKSL